MTLEELILKTIQNREIRDQKTLLNLIAQKGFEIDQPTLSRIFKKLKIQKHLGKYVSLEQGISGKVPQENKITAIPPNLIIIKTKPGFASAVSALLDENPVEGLAGTLAGDDTIFVAILPNFSIDKIKSEIESRI